MFNKFKLGPRIVDVVKKTKVRAPKPNICILILTCQFWGVTLDHKINKLARHLNYCCQNYI